MSLSATQEGVRGAERSTVFVSLLLLWLAGAGLRLTILAIPPVIPMIRADLGLGGTDVGILGGIPMALFALAAIPGSLLIARLGLLRTLVGGLMIIGLGSALRAVTGNALSLFGATVLMSFGIAILQPAMPAAVRLWQPRRIGLATAVFTNGMLLAETLPTALTTHHVLPMLGGNWRADLVFWSLPLALTALLVLMLAPRAEEPRGTTATSGWPNWRDSLIWKLGALFGVLNGTYYAANNFLPDLLISTGRGEAVGAALAALNGGQLPASFLLLFIAQRLEGRKWPYVASAVWMAMALAGLALTTTSTGAVLSAGLLGFAIGWGFILALTLPRLLRPQDVVRTSAAVYTVSYGCGMALSVICGAAWDWVGKPSMAFAPLTVCPFLLAGFALSLHLGRKA
ncbi:MAG: MFS transporter [Candidatus Protistobacter heckmanni]|nr:MFS transporter [Candidatus Protistobacter heckmanni]